MIEVMLAHPSHVATPVRPPMSAARDAALPAAHQPSAGSLHLASSVDAALMVEQLPTGAWAIVNKVPMKDIAERVSPRGSRRPQEGARAVEPPAPWLAA